MTERIEIIVDCASNKLREGKTEEDDQPYEPAHPYNAGGQVTGGEPAFWFDLPEGESADDVTVIKYFDNVRIIYPDLMPVMGEGVCEIRNEAGEWVRGEWDRETQSYRPWSKKDAPQEKG